MSAAGTLTFILLTLSVLVVIWVVNRVLKSEGIPNETVKRVLLTLLVFAAVYFGGKILVNPPSYNAYLEAIFYLSAVIGGGCYWIGSR